MPAFVPFTPLVEELPTSVSPEAAFMRLRHWPNCLFLDSASQDAELGRYSFLAATPFDFYYFQTPDEGVVGLAQLAARLAEFRSETVEGLPPFQGGAAGLFGYELGGGLEQLPRPAYDEFQAPALAVGLYDVVIAFDHLENRAWIISHGWPETDPRRRRKRAERRLKDFRGMAVDIGQAGYDGDPDFRPAEVRSSELAPQFAVPGPKGLTSDFSKEGYLEAVRRAREYVYAGDVFQTNLSQRLLFPAGEDASSLYLRLRACNPAPFAAYFDLELFQIASASPERFVKVVGGRVETRPIKGTRPRTGEPSVDRASADELLGSEKDRSENVMIVDLLRNDLSRVCRPESVEVARLCEIEAYEYVLHLVSVVQGRLREGLGPIDLLLASFPGGSITGAPKVRAMEIIAELEPTARGPYCGSLGYVGFDSSADLNILIRTITAGRGWWQAPVGGGVVAQSNPQAEYEETWHKAEGLIRALQ